MAQSINEQVTARIVQVTAAHTGALTTLEGKFWKSSATEAAIGALKSLQPRMSDWASAGRDGARLNKPPYNRANWQGWLDAGQIILDGVTDITEEADSATLAAIAESVSSSTNETAQAAARVGQRAAQATQRVVRATAETVGTSAAAATRPLLLPLALVAVAIVALAVIKVK
jgi:hypothetical protein